MLSTIGQPIPDTAHVSTIAYGTIRVRCISFLSVRVEIYTIFMRSKLPSVQSLCFVSSPLEQAVSVSLPSWKSTIGYEGGEDWVLSKMRTGYPRFFIHPIIQELEREILAGYGQKDELTMLFPSFATAIRCQAFLLNKEPSLNSANVRIINLVPLAPEKDSVPEIRTLLASLSCVFFPSQYFKLAKQVWQHSGDGISSRRGEFYLTALLEGLLHPEEDRPSPQPKQSRTSRGPRRYQKKIPSMEQSPTLAMP